MGSLVVSVAQLSPASLSFLELSFSFLKLSLSFLKLSLSFLESEFLCGR